MLFALILILFSFASGEEFIIKLKPGTDDSFLKDYTVLKRFGNYVLVDLPAEEIGKLSFKSLHSVEYVARNVKLRAFSVPDDPYFPIQWGMELIRAHISWQKNTDCSSVVVAVIDTGIDYSHEDIQDNMWLNNEECRGRPGVDDDKNGYVDDCYGWDFANDDNGPLDDHRHGTHVAGIIGAVGNNAKGVAGVCWRSKIMAVKILDANGIGSVFDFLRGVYYAVDMGARIINTSLGLCPIGLPSCPVEGENDPIVLVLKDAIKYASDHGVTVVAAAGNDGVDTDKNPVYPASFSKEFANVISVASIDWDGNLSFFSNYGAASVDVAAPGGVNPQGDGVLSLYPSNSYGFEVGTSIASPFVAGALAHLLTLNPNLSPAALKEAIHKNTVPHQTLEGKVKSNGYLNLALLLGLPEEEIPQTATGSGGGCNLGGGYIFFYVLLLLSLKRLLLLYLK